MRGIAALVILLAIGACSGAPPPAVSVSQSASTARTSTPTSSTGVNGPVLPLTRVTFSCRLPVYNSTGASAADSFIDFPSRKVTAAAGRGTFYDSTVARWLLVFQNQISPDGRRYAYTEGWGVSSSTPARVHIVDAATDADVRVVPMPDQQPYFVLDYTSAGIDLGIGYEGRGPGVWRMDPASGAVTKVSGDLYPPGEQWIGVVDPRDGQPYRSAMSGTAEANRIDRRSSTGQMTMWFYKPGHAVFWVAFAGDSALLVQSAWTNTADPAIGGTDYWLVTAPNQATELASYTYQQPSSYSDLGTGFFRAIVDERGIWIGGERGLYLVTQSGLLLRLYDAPAYPAGTCS